MSFSKTFQIAAILLSLTETLSASVFCPDEVYENEEEVKDAFDSDLIARYEMEALIALLKYPVELNGAGKEQLNALPCLSAGLIEKIAAFAEETGFLDKEDLLKIEGITGDIFRVLEPLVSVSLPHAESKVTGSGGAILTKGEENTPEGFLKSETEIGDFVFDGLSLSAGTLFAFSPAYAAKDFRIDGEGAVYEVSRSGFNPSFEKFYLSASYDGFSLLIGSFSAGAGEGLVFNNAGRGVTGIRPDGFISFDTEKGGLYRDDNFLGFAVSASVYLDRHILLDAFAFVSRIKKDLYQYYVENADFLLE
ncbi:MAG: hypothetical protein FJ088_13860, partial [Deltaproteobacteria bacterium]|nr:hypothetical protein [Deltaproteobacteria bacterium]